MLLSLVVQQGRNLENVWQLLGMSLLGILGKREKQEARARRAREVHLISYVGERGGYKLSREKAGRQENFFCA